MTTKTPWVSVCQNGRFDAKVSFMQKKKKVIVVCKTATHRDREEADEEKIYSGRERKKIIYSKTWVRSFVSNLFYSLYSRSGVCDCVCVCDTPDVLFLVVYLQFLCFSVVCMIEKKCLSLFSGSRRH